MRGRGEKGFVTLDVLWIVLMLGLVVVLSVKGAGIGKLRENSDRMKRELVSITKAVEKLAAEEAMEPGDTVEFSQYAPFLEKSLAKRLRVEGEDPLGGKYGEQVVGQEAVPDPATVEALGKFWE